MDNADNLFGQLLLLTLLSLLISRPLSVYDNSQ